MRIARIIYAGFLLLFPALAPPVQAQTPPQKSVSAAYTGLLAAAFAGDLTALQK